VRTAFDGVGSKQAGGRWHSPGRPVVYVSEQRATAALEILVHVKRAQLLRDAYVIFEVTIPDALVLMVELAALPQGWDAYPETRASTDIGDAWFDTGQSVALRVPSVVVRGAYNLLLNPEHPDMAQVTIGQPEPFLFDPRLAE
jgi:RES domain-containing protein